MMGNYFLRFREDLLVQLDSALPFIPQSRELIQKVPVVGTAVYGG
jgi:hypothetical protein